MHALLQDPWVAAEIDRAMAPYAGRLSAKQAAWMREQLAETLATDQAASRLLRGAHPRVVEQSGEVAGGIAGSTASNGATGANGASRAEGTTGKPGLRRGRRGRSS